MGDLDMDRFQPHPDAQSATQAPYPAEGINTVIARPMPKRVAGKRGRPKGFSGRHSKQPSALARAFKKHGLDWQEDFAKAIQANNKARIKLWLRMLPYMITTGSKAHVKKWKGRPSKAAMIALQAMEQEE